MSRSFVVLAAMIVAVMGPATALAISSTGDFERRGPRFGSSTDGQQFFTSLSYNDINIRFTVLPYDVDVKPVRCDNLQDISGYKRVSAGDGTWKVLATNVINYTCYRLNVAAPTVNFFDVKGYVAD